MPKPVPIIEETRSIAMDASAMRMTATVGANNIGIVIMSSDGVSMQINEVGFEEMSIFFDAVRESQEVMRNLAPKGRSPVPPPPPLGS